MPIPPSVLPGGTGFGGGIFGVIPDNPPPTVPGQYNYGLVVNILAFRGQVTPNIIPIGQITALSAYRGAIINFSRIEQLGLNEF